MRGRSRRAGLRGEGRRSSRLRSRRGQGAHARQGPARGAGLLGGGAALSMASNIYVVRQRISRLGQVRPGAAPPLPGPRPLARLPLRPSPAPPLRLGEPPNRRPARRPLSALPRPGAGRVGPPPPRPSALTLSLLPSEDVLLPAQPEPAQGAARLHQGPGVGECGGEEARRGGGRRAAGPGGSLRAGKGTSCRGPTETGGRPGPRSLPRPPAGRPRAAPSPPRLLRRSAWPRVRTG